MGTRSLTHLVGCTRAWRSIQGYKLALTEKCPKWLIRAPGALLLFAGVFGCSSEGTLGIITTSSANVSNLLHLGQAYEEHGPVKGRACHYHFLLIPFGNSEITAALDDALVDTESDAVIHATISKWIAGFPLPLLRSLFDVSCTTITGTAIKFRNLPSGASQ